MTNYAERRRIQRAVAVTCARCNAPLKAGNMSRHKKSCDAMATPAEMAAEFLSSDMYCNEFVRRYKTNGAAIIARLKRGGVTAVQLAGRMNGVIARASRGPCCNRCMLRLNHAEVPKGIKGFCGWCSDGR